MKPVVFRARDNFPARHHLRSGRLCRLPVSRELFLCREFCERQNRQR